MNGKIMISRIMFCLLIAALMAAKVDGAEMSVRFLEGNEAKKSITGRRAAIRESSGAPAIDGKGDDEFWKNAAVLTGFVLNYGGDPQARTEAKLAYDATNLYVLIECAEPQMDKIKAECKEHDGEVWRDDCVELFLAPKNDPAEYYQIMINSLGTVAESRCCMLVNGEQNYDPRWNPEMDAAVVRGEKQWSVEMRIPFRELAAPQDSAMWGINVCRGRKAGHKENSTWSHLTGAFNQPELFGRLVFMAGDLMIDKCEYGTDWGWNRLEVEMAGGKGLNLTARLANETAPDWYEARSAMADDGRAETLIRVGNGRHRMKLDVLDAENRRLLSVYQTFKPRELMTCAVRKRLLFCGEPLNGPVNLGISQLSLNEVALTIRLTDSQNRMVAEKKTGGLESGRIWFECGTQGLPEGVYNLTIILHDQTGRLPLMQWREQVNIMSGY